MSKKISELETTTTINNDDIFVISQSPGFDNSKQITKENIFADTETEIKNSLGTDEYNSTFTYDIGDYCIYDNTLYKCNTTISTAEAFNSNHWEQISILNEIDTINNKKLKIPCCRAKGSGAVTITTTGTGFKLPLSTFTEKNANFTISDGGIKCPYSGIISVTVGAMMSPRAGYAGIAARNGSNSIGSVYEPPGSPTYGVIETSNILAEVTKNDILYMYGQSTATNDAFQMDNERSGMKIIYIEITD